MAIIKYYGLVVMHQSQRFDPSPRKCKALGFDSLCADFSRILGISSVDGNTRCILLTHPVFSGLGEGDASADACQLDLLKITIPFLYFLGLH